MGKKENVWLDLRGFGKMWNGEGIKCKKKLLDICAELGVNARHRV